MPAKMYKMGFVMLDKFSWSGFLRLPPDEIHFQMNCTECQTRLEDQKHGTRLEKDDGAEECGNAATIEYFTVKLG